MLIFPDETSLGPDDNVANVILSEIRTDEPAAVASRAKEAAKAAWRQQAGEILKDPRVAPAIERERWDAQVDDVVEFFAAWVELANDAAYHAQRKRVMRLLAGRKACRNFLPSVEQSMKIRKSSLDGARETVLKPGTAGGKRNGKLRLNEGEQLDVVGLTKRHGSRKQNYPSVSRIAADPWLYGLRKRDENAANKLLEGCKRIDSKVLTPICWRRFDHFPYEGSVVYIERHRELLDEAEAELEEQTRQDLDVLKLRDIYKSAGQPSPYAAILRADGDDMRRLISGVRESPDHRALSKQLCNFAEAARGIVERHFGALVYAGGDDVLALVPVDMALHCARELHDSFGERLAAFCSARGLQPPTLSTGIGIGHFMEPLEDLLGYARDAEKSAKHPDRNGLAIHFHTRGGEPSKIRGRWDSDFPVRLGKLIGLYTNELLAEKAGYDLETCARKYDGLEEEWLGRSLPGEAAYVLGRKRGAAGAPELREVLRTATSAKALHGVARELIIARRLAGARRESGERTPMAAVTPA